MENGLKLNPTCEVFNGQVIPDLFQRPLINYGSYFA